MEISGTVAHSNTSIDTYIENVTYNFSVPISWIDSRGASPNAIKLFKYNNGWHALPTLITGANATYYSYSAVSDSFSNYVVGIATGTNTCTGCRSISNTVSSGYPTYFYALGYDSNGSSSRGFVTPNWVNDTSAFAANKGAKTSYASAIGHNVTSGGNTGSATFSQSGDSAIAGIGANVIFSTGNFQTANTGSTRSTTLTLPYTVSAPGSFVIFAIADGGSSFSVTLPLLSCTSVSTGTALTDAGAEVANCTLSSSGSLDIVSVLPGSISAAAYEFPPYSVAFNDNPTTGNIVAGGVRYANGASNSIIGTGTVNAIAPGSGYVFGSWSASNSNVTFGSATSQNTIFTVEGNSIVTATWNGPTTFSETGLPANGESWNVIYDGISQSAVVANSITFTTAPGSYSFSVANVVVGGVTYVPAPASGTLAAFNTTTITFSGGCQISLSPNSITFGSLTPGSTYPTDIGVTDTNNGAVAANVLVSGGNWIGGALSFGVSNTLWSQSSEPTYTGTALTASLANTPIVIGAGGSNSIYFGLGAPLATPAATYSQTITIENSC